MVNYNELKFLYEGVKADLQRAKIPFNQNNTLHINTRAKRIHGCCRKEENSFRIEISSFVLSYPENEIKDIIAHELIHTCYGCLNHGKKFKMYCNKINAFGYNVTTTYKGENYVNEEQFAKYKIVCEECNLVIYRMKLSPLIKNIERYRCGKCGGKLKVFKKI
jgi:predicted SprT family Zn-dependent metalloprotease